MVGYKGAHAEEDAWTNQVEGNSCLLVSRLVEGWGEWSRHKEVQTPGVPPLLSSSPPSSLLS